MRDLALVILLLLAALAGGYGIFDTEAESIGSLINELLDSLNNESD